jgi:hypothetical protein
MTGENMTNGVQADPMHDYIEAVPYSKLVEANARATPDARAHTEQSGMDASSKSILAAELPYLQNWRRASGASRSTDPQTVKGTITALALSGGGIRSATFSLGVLQALAAADKVRRFDYLSTVSGGGYIGASLTWFKRNWTPTAGALEDTKTFPYPVDPPNAQHDRRATPRQGAQLIHLRQHGKYLMPGHGIDAVSLVAVLLRGFFLNLLVWLPIMSLALLVAMLLPPASTVLPALSWLDPGVQSYGYSWALLIAAAAAALFAVLCVIYSVVTFFKTKDDPRRYRLRQRFERDTRYFLWAVAILSPIGLMPLAAEAADGWLEEAGVASILAGLASAAGTFMRSRSGNGSGPITTALVAPLGALLMLYGMLMLSFLWARSFYDCTNFGGAFPWYHLACESSGLWWAWIVLLIAAVVTGFFVNVNLISVHRYYRDRLMETFLPDEPTRAGDTYEFSTLATLADTKRLHECNRLDQPTGPYHLLNTNVILVDSKDPQWRVRGGDSFILSPLLCGSNSTGWCDTRAFLGGDLSLATAMAISGAAANPYAGGGVFRNRPVAVLMALANVRLGYWVRHPNSKIKGAARRNHFSTAWRELSGKLDESRPLLQLSDGGHFDNLGLYELIRRRVKLVVACDGTADPQFGFADFIALLARIEADFGARIAFNRKAGLEVFMPKTAAGFPRNAELAERGFTVGRITYSDGSTGDLIYVTTTLFEGLGLQTLGYRAANPDFPDQATTDQFFDEAQFEAYRHLGYSVGEALLKDGECAKILDQRLV